MNLQFLICVIGHCGRAKRRGAETTFKSTLKYFKWSTMRADIATFCNFFLHCALTAGGHRNRIPMGHSMHYDTLKELNQFDFLCMYQSSSEHIYALIIKDDASSLVWLIPCDY